MSTRARMEEMVSALLDFGVVVSTAVTAGLKSVTAKITADDNGDGTGETVDGQELWGNAAILARPKAPDASGSAEVIVWRRGDELVGIASRDVRGQVTLEEGE